MTFVYILDALGWVSLLVGTYINHVHEKKETYDEDLATATIICNGIAVVSFVVALVICLAIVI